MQQIGNSTIAIFERKHASMNPLLTKQLVGHPNEAPLHEHVMQRTEHSEPPIPRCFIVLKRGDLVRRLTEDPSRKCGADDVPSSRFCDRI